jgi:hypothetical protein
VYGLASRVLLILGCLWVLAPSSQAQEKHVFHAAQDLEGFEASDLSEWSDLYALADFKAFEGKELEAAALADLRARWKGEQARAGKRIAEIQADPRERWVWQLGKKLARHGYFSKIAYTIERPEPGYVMVLQRPAKEEPGYAARIAGFYMPFVRKAVQNFDEQVARPAGLARQEGHELTAFAVLASQGDLENFTKFVQDPSGYSSRSAYDYQLQLAVTYEDPFASGVSIVSQRTSLLYRVVKRLEHAYLAIPGNRPGSIWLCEGLAFLFATHEGATPDSLDKRSPRAESLEWLVELLGKQPAREIVLMPLDELVGLRSWIDFEKAIAARTKRLEAEDPDEQDVGMAYYAQSELWLHFLFDGAQAARRPQLLEFVKAAFRGRGDAQDLRRILGASDTLGLSRDFLRWACDEYERTHPGKKADRAPIETLFGSAPPAAAGASPSAGAPAAAAPLVDPAFSPQMLAPYADDADAQLALALRQARAGDIAGALDALRALAALAKTPPWPERIARESARLEELAKLRDGYLAFLKSSGAKLSFKHNGKDLMAPVTSIEGGLVHLGENKLGLASIALSEVDPYEVAKVAAKKEMQGGAQPWARFYAYVLAGDARWEKLLKDESASAKELRTDAGEFPELARTATLARELYELSKLPLPGGAADARARLERVKALLSSGTDTSLLKRQLDSLRQLALACLAVDYAEQGLGVLLHGKSSALEGGRTKLEYSFGDAREGEDWVKVPGYFQRNRDRMPKIGYTDAQSHFDVAKGALRGVGSVGYRFAAPFVGPVSVRYRFHYEQIDKAYEDPRFSFVLCETAPDSCYRNTPGGEMYVDDDKHNDFRHRNPATRPTFDWDKDWSQEFSYDGKELTAKFEGQEYLRMPAGKLDAGYVGFVVHSELPIVIADIELEGRFDPAAVSRLQSAWATRELRALGFP